MGSLRPSARSILPARLHVFFRCYQPRPPFGPRLTTVNSAARNMSSAREDSVPHEVRTAAEPRQNRLYTVRLSQIVQVNPMIRLLRLTLPPPATEQTQTQEVWNLCPVVYLIY